MSDPSDAFERGPLKVSRDGALLRELGLMTASGSISADTRRKFQQVNHMVALLLPLIEAQPAVARIQAQPAVARIQAQPAVALVDANCGRSYLGFLLAHAVRQSGRSVTLFGYDRDPLAIGRCRERAARLGYSDCEFLTGTAADVGIPAGPSLFLSLHGCDTATDEALLAAVGCTAAHVAIVPCCHREVRPLLGPQHDFFRRDGIIADDYAALFSDALRADWLRAQGWRTDVIEFVPLEHTARNRLLRGTHHGRPDTAASARVQAALQTLSGAPALLR